jgi:hypothetical protein
VNGATRHIARRFRLAAAGLGVAVAIAACSSDGPGSSATTSTSVATTTSVAATTTAAPTTVAAPVTTATGASTTVAPVGPLYPLTGLPADDAARAGRAALVVKIDNNPQARPQSGLNQADIVFEENVEFLTRFAAVFQSHDSDPVGPIRSGRTQDIILLGSLDRPLFAWSGGNANVTRAIADSDLVDLNWQKLASAGVYSRQGKNPAPHNLYSKTSVLFGFTPLYAPAPPAQFVYRQAGEAFNGTASTGAKVAMDGVKVDWTWDRSATTFVRSQDGKPHLDAAGEQVDAANVVVLEVDYKPSPADARSPEAQTIGTGKVTVLTAGVLVQGTWTRADRLKPFTLTDPSGAPIALSPGRTWVELARSGAVTAHA